MTSAATVTTAMVQPITDAISANVGVLLPVGVGIMAIMVGISLIPRIVYKFL
jgi:hypothetical protein